MGYFSWMSADDITKPILIGSAAAVLIPEQFGGGFLFEENYQGYGVFGERDIYGLLTEWNQPENHANDKEARFKGISIQSFYEFGGNPIDFKIKIISLSNIIPIDDVNDDDLTFDISFNHDLYDKIKNKELTYESLGSRFSLSDPNQGFGLPDGYDLEELGQQENKLMYV